MSYKPRLSLKFDPPLRNKVEYDDVAKVLHQEYPDLLWSDSASLMGYDPFDDTDEIYHLSIGYYSHKPDRLTYSAYEHDEGEPASIDGYQWLKDKSVDYDVTTALFDSLYESSGSHEDIDDLMKRYDWVAVDVENMSEDDYCSLQKFLFSKGYHWGSTSGCMTNTGGRLKKYLYIGTLSPYRLDGIGGGKHHLRISLYHNSLGEGLFDAQKCFESYPHEWQSRRPKFAMVDIGQIYGHPSSEEMFGSLYESEDIDNIYWPSTYITFDSFATSDDVLAVVNYLEKMGGENRWDQYVVKSFLRDMEPDRTSYIRMNNEDTIVHGTKRFFEDGLTFIPYQTIVSISDFKPFENLNEASQSINTVDYKPKLVLKFKPPVMKADELDLILNLIQSLYPGVHWYNQSKVEDLVEKNPIRINHSNVWYLHVGYYLGHPDSLTYGSSEGGYKWSDIAIDGYKWLETVNFDTEDMFSKLYESDDLEWAQNMFHNMVEVSYQDLKIGDVIYVNGFDGYTSSYKVYRWDNDIATVVNTYMHMGGSVPTLRFNDWFHGHGEKENEWDFWKRNTKDIKFYKFNDSLNESVEEDPLAWAQEVVKSEPKYIVLNEGQTYTSNNTLSKYWGLTYGELVRPHNGDICYMDSKVYHPKPSGDSWAQGEDIYHMIRVSDGGHFFIQSSGIRPYVD